MTRLLHHLRALLGPAALAALLCALSNLSLWRIPPFTVGRWRIALWSERNLDGGPYLAPLWRYGIGCLSIGAGLVAWARPRHAWGAVGAYAGITAGAGLGTLACYIGHWAGNRVKRKRRAPLQADAEAAAYAGLASAWAWNGITLAPAEELQA